MCETAHTGSTRRARLFRHNRAASAAVAVVGAVCLIVLPCGCHGLRGSSGGQQRSFTPARDPAGLSNVAFLHYLATVPVATFDEASRAILVLAGDERSSGTFTERFEALRERGAVKRSWGLSAGDVVDKGTLAHMLKHVCGLPSGLGDTLASLTGWGDRRAALRTCVDSGILPYGVASEPVRGGELVAAMTEAERYLATHASSTP